MLRACSSLESEIEQRSQAPVARLVETRYGLRRRAVEVAFFDQGVEPHWRSAVPGQQEVDDLHWPLGFLLPIREFRCREYRALGRHADQVLSRCALLPALDDAHGGEALRPFQSVVFRQIEKQKVAGLEALGLSTA